LFFPRKLLEEQFTEVTKPSASFTDEGVIGPVRWHYECSAAPRKVTVSLDTILPLQFIVDVPSQVFGVAGAGMKVKCIYVEAGSLGFTGEIDKLEVYFRFGLNIKTGELLFQSKLGVVKAKKFSFHHSPTANTWPVDFIADFLLSRAAEIVVMRQAGALLNRTRIPLVRFSAIQGFGRLSPVISITGDTTLDSVTVGVTFTRL
jgi:hypothetical protein